jgi:hypothetical protein
MVTHKALGELATWARAASEGHGEEAKQHLINFRHLGAAFLASDEFHAGCRRLHGREFDFGELEQMCQILDAIANIEVLQVEKYGMAQP